MWLKLKYGLCGEILTNLVRWKSHPPRHLFNTRVSQNKIYQKMNKLGTFVKNVIQKSTIVFWLKVF
jgi:hypothetical protein